MSDSPGIVFVVDDDPSLRCTLGGLIRSVGLQADLLASAKDFLNTTLPQMPSCITLDVRLPGMSGLDLQRRLVEANIAIPIIFLTGQGDVAMSVRAMKAGAFDFFTKPSHEQDLLDAIVRAVDQDRVRRRQVSELGRLQALLGSLRPREREVLNGVVSGLPNKQIAATLGTSEATVKSHRGALMRKMHADSLADLVRMVDKVTLASQP